MRRAAADAGRGFTLIELVIVLVIVGLLAALAAQRLRILRVEAERTALIQVLGGLRAALSLEVLTLISQGRDAEIARLAGSNPMDSLLEPPRNYAGAYASPDPERIAPGRWYFDRGAGLLGYRVRYADYFVVGNGVAGNGVGGSASEGGPARALFRVELVWDDRDGNGRFDPGVDGVGGARLRPLAAYGWRRD